MREKEEGNEAVGGKVRKEEEVGEVKMRKGEVGGGKRR